MKNEGKGGRGIKRDSTGRRGKTSAYYVDLWQCQGGREPIHGFRSSFLSSRGTAVISCRESRFNRKSLS
jgi:hypothetical protein